jgi:cell wall-associated NlpC family hydrolase
MEDELLVEEELGDWVKVSIEEGDGFVHADYVVLTTEFREAESKEEEAIRLAKEEEERQRARDAAARRAARNNNNQQSSSNANNDAPVVYASGGGSELGNAVANYGLQFVGNPYKYGGSSLTNGTDCSGFTTAVYANFGVSLPRTSGSQRRVGTAVDGLANAQPGDIICYSGHVGIYIGSGQIVHASTAQTGIKVSSATYRKVLAVRRVF